MADAERVISVERDGLVLDVIDEGPIGGEPVVLLHGFPERATAWRRVAPLLHEAGFRTLALDQRGYAPGARPRRRRDYRTTELALDVVALIDRVGGSAHVVGHDWGAIVAWTVAQHHPTTVRTLTAVSVTHPAAFLRATYRSSQALRSWYMAAFQLPGVAERLARTRLFPRMLATFGMTREEVERCLREVVESGALKGGLMYYRALPLNDPRDLRVPVRVPTTMVFSTGDTALSAWGARHCGEHVEAPYDYVELAGVSHWIPTQEPEALAEAIVRRAGGSAP
jgi:pimeloyl-ACP methyl ester carboxylesterase